MKQTLIAISLIFLASCQDDESTIPTGIAYEMAGTYNVIYSPTTAPAKTVTLTVQPLSANRALLVYNPYTGSSGAQSLWLSPNDTIDFNPNSEAVIGPDTFNVNNSLVIHRGVGTYTENSIIIPQHRHTVNLYTYTARIQAIK